MKTICKIKKIWTNGGLLLENIGNYARKYFNDNNLCIIQDTQLGWYNFKFGYKKYYDSKVEEINKKYKIITDDEYWYILQNGSDDNDTSNK